jgi:hypothetical protein
LKESGALTDFQRRISQTFLKAVVLRENIEELQLSLVFKVAIPPLKVKHRNKPN